MNANVGMLCPVVATVASYTAGTGITYNTGKKVAEAVSASISWNRSDGKFYGDDVLLDSDNGVTGYQIEFEPSGLTDEVRGYILGETVQSSEYSITEAASPDVGFGYVRVMRTSNTSGVVNESYEGWWYHRLKFGVTSEQTRTKEQNVEWRIPTLTGVGEGVQLDSGMVTKFAVHKTFASKSDAVAYVKGKAGIT